MMYKRRCFSMGDGTVGVSRGFQDGYRVCSPSGCQPHSRDTPSSFQMVFTAGHVLGGWDVQV
jgi:hypothetical protein